MRHRTLFILLVTLLPAIAGCTGGSGAIGEPCSYHRDCNGQLQCAAGVCANRCKRSPECGDGYICDLAGLCQVATGESGESCISETDCAPGLSCQIDDNDAIVPLVATCTAQNVGRPPGSTCETDGECRNGTCALGHCLDLCGDTRDCSIGSTCMEIPRVEDVSTKFAGCLPAHGTMTWSIPVSAPMANIVFPVPSAASSASLVFRVDDPAQYVGALNVTSPRGQTLYNRPCNVMGCNPEAEFYANPVRHLPELGQSVLAMPTTPSVPFEPGAYRIQVSSLRANGQLGSAIPQVTGVIRVDSALLLDLHFYFLDLDGLDIANAGALLELGSHATGINVFFVRTLSPVGLQAFGPNPGPAGLANTARSGIAISADTLCYRSWDTLARLTAHEVARYMGLYHNVEIDSQWRDKIEDSDDSPNNLMFYSELGGTVLSPGQREILTRSAVLR